MRVLYLVDTLNVGGTETQMAKAALCLHRAGHRVTVACLRQEGPLVAFLRGGGVPVVEFRKRKTLFSLNGFYQLLRLAFFLKRHNFQVLHAHDLWANLLGVPAARLAGTPVIISSRRYLADLDWYTPRRNKIVRLIYRLSTHVVTNSKEIHKLLLERDGLPRQKIHVIHNGVDCNQFVRTRQNKNMLFPGFLFTGPKESAKLIAVVANMYDVVKGHDHLIDAARTVCREAPEATFLLIGDGQERPRLEQKVEAAGLKKNLLFLGQCQDIPELLACCDLSVLPSQAEGLPNALLEAMAAGLPVVATQVGGIPELVESGVTGLLVPPGDSHALAHAILLVLQDSALATRLASAGQERMRTHFSFERLTAELEDLYAPGQRRNLPELAKQLRTEN